MFSDEDEDDVEVDDGDGSYAQPQREQERLLDGSQLGEKRNAYVTRWKQSTIVR